jgi:signal transduction histidine kinase
MRSTAAPNRRLSRLTVHLWLTLGVSLLLAVSFAFYVRAEKKIDVANELRQQAAFLANQLRQSSDELTRMARTYVATGEAQYRTQFEQIVAVRDGRLPRSAEHPNNYWEVLPADALHGGAAAGALPLMALIRRAGFTQQEIALLEQAKSRSDALTVTELAAMGLLDAGKPSPAAARAQASAMLHGEDYHRAKDGILAPIRQFSQLADQRTLTVVQLSEQRAFQLRVVFLCLVAMLLMMVWMARGEVLAVLGGTVPQLYRHISRLGSGDFSAPPPAAPRDSVLGWVGETQQRLAQADAERKQAEGELAQYRSGLEQLVEERTQALAAALDRAEAASRAKSVFLSNMSHELRTPLNAVIGFSELMGRSQSLSEDERENLRFIHHSGQHLLTLIDQVLALSRTDADPARPAGGLSDVEQLGAQPAAPFPPAAGLAADMAADMAAGLAAVPQADVQALDDATYEALCNAVQHLDRKGLNELLLRVAPPHPALARSIEAMAERLEYRELWEALQQARSANAPAK